MCVFFPYPSIEKELDKENHINKSDVEDSEGQACEGEVCRSTTFRSRCEACMAGRATGRQKAFSEDSSVLWVAMVLVLAQT